MAKISKLSPMGKCEWAKVNTVVDEFNGKRNYSIQLEVDNPQAFLAELKGYYEEGKQDAKFAGTKFNDKKAVFGEKELEDGRTVFIFKTSAFYTDKQGNEVQKVVPVFNRYGQRIDMTKIGNGSVVQISYTPMVYNKLGNQGLFLALNQVLVKDLVEFGGEEPAFTFDEFTGESDDEEIPV